MKDLGLLFFLPLIGAINGQDYCPKNATGCHDCSARWDYNNLTSIAYLQTDGKCKVDFSWNFENLEDDSNPWLDFQCQYLESGESCNSEYEVTCASCGSYTITDINMLYNPIVIYYDSCDNFFEMPLTEHCVSANEETTKNPLTTIPEHGCYGCSERWDYNNITSVARFQENGKCTVEFSWHFKYLLDDLDPWLDFKCEYFKTGESCSSEFEITCASGQNLAITDINMFHNPHITFYDSCDNYFDMPLTKPCVNARDAITKI